VASRSVIELGNYAFTGSVDIQGQALGSPQARNHGLAAWTYDPAIVSGGKAGVSGTIYLAGMYVPRSLTATKLFWGVGTAAATVTAGANWVGLYSAAGTRLASNAADSKITSTGVNTDTISAALTPGLYWAAFLFAATTMPQIYRAGDVSATLMNCGLGSSPSTLRFATNGTGTTLPSTITPASNVSAQFSFWAALG
jgi:hypothetical protein